MDDKEKVVILRKALIGLIGGSEDPLVLDKMEHYLRTIEAPNSDKVVSINAIDAIRITSEPSSS